MLQKLARAFDNKEIPMRAIAVACFFSFGLAGPAAADPMIVFSVQGIPLCAGGASSGCGGLAHFGSEFATVSVTGIGTPLNSGVTINGHGGGFSWIVPVAGEDSNNWYLGATDIIIEASFDFSGNQSILEPGDIGQFGYSGFGSTTPFSISKDGSPLEFSVSIDLRMDPRLEAFYGLAPPCLVSPSYPPQVGGCSNFAPFSETFSGVGMPTDNSGYYVFTGQVDATFVPEPASVYLVLTIFLGFGWVKWRQYRKSPL